MYGYDLKSVMRYRIDMRECRTLLRHGSHSFYAASLLLPREFRAPVTALYAFCRVSDDAIDAGDSHEASLRALHQRLRRIYEDRPSNSPVDRAFAHVVHTCGIPYALPAALLEGFEWDVSGRRYETLSDVYAYSARVAGTVGVMMALLMGVRRPDVLSRACDLGIAMQLTNIARDVGEDARAGRLYLPGELLRAQGVDPAAWLAAPAFNDAIRRAVTRLLAAADRLYERAEWGIGQLPLGCRPGIFAARSIYAEIGREIERSGGDSVSRRAIVGTGRKLRLLTGAVEATLCGRKPGSAPGLREARFLIDAVAEA